MFQFKVVKTNSYFGFKSHQFACIQTRNYSVKVFDDGVGVAWKTALIQAFISSPFCCFSFIFLVEITFTVVYISYGVFEARYNGITLLM